MNIEDKNNAYEPKNSDTNMSAKDFEKIYNNRENISEPNVSFDSPILLKRMRTADNKDVFAHSELEARNNRMRNISDELSALNSSMQNIKDVGVSYKQKEEIKIEESIIETKPKTERIPRVEVQYTEDEIPKPERKKPIYGKELKKETLKKPIIKKAPIKKIKTFEFDIEKFLKFYMIGTIAAIAAVVTVSILVLANII